MMTRRDMGSRMARGNRTRRLMIAVTVVVLCVAISFTASPQQRRRSINVYFNHSISREHAESRRNFANGEADLQAVIISRIDAAKSTIDLAVHEFNLVQIANALTRAKDRGVQVRCIVENNYTEPGFRPLSDEDYGELSEAKRTEYDAERAELDVNGDDTLDETEIRASIPMVAVLDTLEKYEVPCIDYTENASRGSDLMHNKFAIFDAEDRKNAWVLTGSTNWTQSGIGGDLDEAGNRVTHGNANNLVEVQSRDLAGIHLDQFQHMWGDGPGGRGGFEIRCEEDLQRPTEGGGRTRSGRGPVLAPLEDCRLRPYSERLHSPGHPAVSKLHPHGPIFLQCPGAGRCDQGEVGHDRWLRCPGSLRFDFRLKKLFRDPGYDTSRFARVRS